MPDLILEGKQLGLIENESVYIGVDEKITTYLILTYTHDNKEFTMVDSIKLRMIDIAPFDRR